VGTPCGTPVKRKHENGVSSPMQNTIDYPLASGDPKATGSPRIVFGETLAPATRARHRISRTIDLMEEEMSNRKGFFWAAGCLVVMWSLTILMGCSEAPKHPENTKPAVKKIPAGQEFSGFLKDYSALKPNPYLGEDVLTYASADAEKNLRSYIAMIVDPIEVYVATNADESQVSEDARTALTRYFRHALIRAVSDAFPIVETPGPLTLRLRTALVGVDIGGEVGSDVPSDSQPLKRALNIGKVRVEMELVDSQTGDRIAAMVDNANLGAGAEVGALQFSRLEKFAAARDAFDEWASRVREFLDAEHELGEQDAMRADKAYQPY
jgi:hypothetical protein